MDKKRYQELLERIYELEGLLLLATGKEEVPASLHNLIEKKLARLIEAEKLAEKEEEKEEPVLEIRPVKRSEPEQRQQRPEPNFEAEPRLEPEPEPVESPFYALEDDDDTVAAPPPRSKNRHHHGKGRRKLPVFSLNDRFLFLRELFDGDATSFNTALNRIASSSGIEEATEYLKLECGLTPDDSDTDARFLYVIEEYFRLHP